MAAVIAAATATMGTKGVSPRTEEGLPAMTPIGMRGRLQLKAAELEEIKRQGAQVEGPEGKMPPPTGFQRKPPPAEGKTKNQGRAG